MKELTGFALVVVLILFLIFIGPVLLLWSVGQMANGEGLDLNFWNWLAALVFLLLVRGSTSSS